MSRMDNFHKNLLIYSVGVGVAVVWLLVGAVIPFAGLLGFGALFGWAAWRAYCERHAGLTVFMAIFAIAFTVSAFGRVVSQ